MRERPILFSTPMVRALLEGRKTQTRRVVKPQPPTTHNRTCDCKQCQEKRPDYWWYHDKAASVSKKRGKPHTARCPYGVPGDLLWLWENLWRGDDCWTYEAGRDTVKIDPGAKDLAAAWVKKTTRDVVPSNHMPRWACRIWLEITGVRVERVQDISEADAKAEGFDVEACEAAFGLAAGRSRLETEHWIETEDGDSSFCGSYCRSCAEKELKKHKCCSLRFAVGAETDGPAYCEDCGVALDVCLTDYGIDRELYREGTDWESGGRQDASAKGRDARIFERLARNVGEQQLGRLAQIGFATLWDQLNGEGSWTENPWVWVLDFKVLEVRR